MGRRWHRGAGRADAAWWRRREALWPIRLPRFAGSLAEKLREWLIAEVGPGRLMPWLPIAFGSGIVVYFAADREPALTAVLALFGVLAVCAMLARKRPVAFPVLLGAAAVTAARLIWRGAYRLRFWIGVALGGVALPLLLLIGGAVSGWMPLSTLGALLALAGLWFWEDLWVRAGQSVPLS